MAVYERTYRAYAGPLTDPRWRFTVLPRYALAEIFRSRLFAGFLLLCCLPPLGFAAWVYLPHNLKFLETFAVDSATAATLFRVDSAFFVTFLWIQLFLSLILALAVGPALISPDLRNNGLPLYLARPFGRAEYILGKALVLLSLLSAITWIPGLLLFGWQCYLGGWTWSQSHLRVGPAIFFGSWIWILILCLLSLALSAYLKWKPLARVALIGAFFGASIMANTINFMFSSTWGSFFDIAAMIQVVWAHLFGTPSVLEFPAPLAWVSLLTTCALCLVLLARKLRAYEVVR